MGLVSCIRRERGRRLFAYLSITDTFTVFLLGGMLSGGGSLAGMRCESAIVPRCFTVSCSINSFQFVLDTTFSKETFTPSIFGEDCCPPSR